MVIIIGIGDMGGPHGQKPTITFTCERSVVYKGSLNINIENESNKQGKGRLIRVKKCEYEFTLKSVKLAIDDDWMLVVKCDIIIVAHNISNNIFFVGCLSEEEISMLVKMSKNNLNPKNILNSLKHRDELNCSTVRTIYNAKYKHEVKEYGG